MHWIDVAIPGTGGLLLVLFCRESKLRLYGVALVAVAAVYVGMVR